MNRISLEGGDQPLHQGRGVDETKDPVGKDKGSRSIVCLFAEGTHCNIADPFPGEGEILRMGSHPDGVGVVIERKSGSLTPS